MMTLYLRDDTLRIKFTLVMGAQGRRKTLTRVGVDPRTIGFDSRCSTDWATGPDVSMDDVMSRQMNTDELSQIAQSAEQRWPSIPTLVSDFLFPCTSGTISTPRANAKMDIGSFITSLYTLMVHFIVMWDTVYVKLSSQCSVCLCFFGFFAVFVSYNLRQRNCVAAVNNGTCNCFLLLCTEQQECNTGVPNTPRCTLRPAFGQVLNGVYNTNHCDCPLVG